MTEEPKKGDDKKRKLIVWIVSGGCAVAVLGLCCVGTGLGFWFFVFKSSPEKSFVGKWRYDDKKGMLVVSAVCEFKPGGTFVWTLSKGFAIDAGKPVMERLPLSGRGNTLANRTMT
jgi:hypothetical protein